jgi:hypothetical protein
MKGAWAITQYPVAMGGYQKIGWTMRSDCMNGNHSDGDALEGDTGSFARMMRGVHVFSGTGAL